PVVVVSFEDDLFVLLGANEAKWAGADGMHRHLAQAALGHNANRTVGEIPQQSGEGLFQVEHNREVVRCVDVVDGAIDAGLGGADLSCQQGIERPLHVTRGEGSSVVKLYGRSNMEDVSKRVRNFPAFRECRFYVEMLIAIQQVIEDQAVDALRLRVDADSWI